MFHYTNRLWNRVNVSQIASSKSLFTDFALVSAFPFFVVCHFWQQKDKHIKQAHGTKKLPIFIMSPKGAVGHSAKRVFSLTMCCMYWANVFTTRTSPLEARKRPLLWSISYFIKLTPFLSPRSYNIARFVHVVCVTLCCSKPDWLTVLFYAVL